MAREFSQLILRDIEGPGLRPLLQLRTMPLDFPLVSCSSIALMNEGSSSVTNSPPPASPLPPGSAAVEQALPGARHALILLVLINLFNYIDRQVLAAVEPHVRKEFFGDDPSEKRERGLVNMLSSPKGQMGLLSTAFLATYMLAAPIFGYLANRMSRWVLIGLGVIIWSLASGASGLATLYWTMFLTRCLVGIGEAVYGPVAPDVISDLYPVKKRGQVLAWFYAAIPFGGALGYALGAEVVKYSGDWRNAFFLVVPPGILLGIWCFFLPEPPRGRSDNAIIKRKESLSDYLVLLKTPSYLLNTTGMTCMCFAMGGLAFWVPAYLQAREVPPLFGVEPATAFGGGTALAGLAATLLGGIVGDRLRDRFSGSYFLVSGTAMLLGVPMLLLMIALPFPLAWLPLIAFVFCLFFNTGPTNTILANVCHPLLRPAGFALNILIIHLLGDAGSPFVIGVVADSFDDEVEGFNRAFQMVSVMVLLGGLLWLWGARYLKRDMELAPNRLASPSGATP